MKKANLVACLFPTGHPNYEQFNCFKQTKHLPMVAKSSKLLETDEAFNCFDDSKVRFFMWLCVSPIQR
jgi:hypothetical protein